jgi:polysaccharide biosynthesis transport protein
MPTTLRAQPDDVPEYAGAFPLSTLVRIGWRGKWFLALGALLGLGYGLACYLGEPPVYQSATQVLVVRKQQSDAMPFSRMDTAAYFEDYLAEHVALIKSPLIVDRAVKSGNLRSLKSFAGLNNPTNAIIGSLSITRDSTTNPLESNHILKLSVSGADPEDCRAVLKAVLESYKHFLEETYRSVGEETVRLITEARNVLQKDLARKAKEYQEFRENAPLLSHGKNGVTLHQETLTRLQSARSDLLLRKTRAQGNLNAIEGALRKGQSPETLLSILCEGEERKALAALQKDLFALLAQEKEMLRKYGADHPDVLALREKIDVTRDLATRPARVWARATKSLSDSKDELFVKNLVEDYLRSLRQELENLQLEENAFTELSKSLEAEARRLLNYEIQDETMKSDTLRTQQLYDSVLQRLNEVNLTKDMGGFNAQVVFPPEGGVRLPTKVIPKILTAMFFGLLGGFVLASVANFFDRSFHSPEEIRRRLGVAVVGHIPLLQPAAKALHAGSDGANILDPKVCTYHHPRSRETEAFRGLRTALYFNTGPAGQKVLQITSPDVGDGKTTVATNLAACIAQSAKKVLLIDADFRMGRLHTVFGLSARVGLASVLAGAVELGEAIQPSVVPGLFVLAAGAVPPNPAELLTSPRFKEVLDRLRGEYDYVLVDTPPLLAVTDPSVVAPCVDGVLLVVRIAKKDDGPNAERAMEMLSALGAQVVGIVVNCVNPVSRFGPYAYRSYGYGKAYASSYDTRSGENPDTGPPPGNAEGQPVVIRATRETLVDIGKSSAEENSGKQKSA